MSLSGLDPDLPGCVSVSAVEPQSYIIHQDKLWFFRSNKAILAMQDLADPKANPESQTPAYTLAAENWDRLTAGNPEAAYYANTNTPDCRVDYGVDPNLEYTPPDYQR